MTCQSYWPWMHRVVAYRPTWVKDRWWAWVAQSLWDAHKPAWARSVEWLPISEKEYNAYWGRSH